MIRYGVFSLCVVMAACSGGGGNSATDGGNPVDGNAGIVDARGPDATSTIDGSAIDSGIIVVLPDASISPDAMPFTGVCNPVTQAGCNLGEKCAQLVVSDDPFLSQTTCVPDGVVSLGGACTDGEPGSSTGYDDCTAGGNCLGGLCMEICSTAGDTCRAPEEVFGEGSYCTRFADVFSDDIGLCVAACFPTNDTTSNGIVTNDSCGAGNGCYLNAGEGVAACSSEPGPSAGITQNEECYGPIAGSCYLNGCASGFTALLPTQNGTNCIRYCSPTNSHLGAQGSVTGADNKCGTLNLVGGTNGDTAEHQCRFVQSVFSNSGGVPESVGMCTSTADWDDCRTFDWDGIQLAWNTAITNGTDPETAFNQFCYGTPTPDVNDVIFDSCVGYFRGCISLAEQEAGLPAL